METQWYMIQAHSGKEHKAVDLLKQAIERKSRQTDFEEIVVPEQVKMKVVRGKKQEVKVRPFPGYVLIKMKMGPETLQLVKSVRYITGVAGANQSSPAPISEAEAEKILGRLQKGEFSQDPTHGILAGDRVKILDGPFSSFDGEVESVDAKGKLKVMVSIFGRPTPVEISAEYVEVSED